MNFGYAKNILPGGKKLDYGFSYSSDNNTEWLSIEQLKELLKTVEEH